MNQSLLLTDSTYNTDTLASLIRLADGHVPLDPNSLREYLIVELSLINVHNLLASLHEFSYLHRHLLLCFSYFFLVFILATVSKLRTDEAYLVLLVEIGQSLI